MSAIWNIGKDFKPLVRRQPQDIAVDASGRMYVSPLREDLAARGYAGIIESIDGLAKLCGLLGRAENHLMVKTRQRVQKAVQTRTVADMVNEMTGELTNLPKYTAYTKVLLDGGSTIWRGKMITRKLEPLKLTMEMPADIRRTIIHFKTREFVKKRKEIEDEIRHRQGAWAGAGVEAQRPVVKRVEEQPGISTTRPVGQPEEPPPQEA